MLIDADALSDVFKKQFYSDIKSYDITAKENYNFRRNNIFYTKTAKVIFNKELKRREKELNLI